MMLTEKMNLLKDLLGDIDESFGWTSILMDAAEELDRRGYKFSTSRFF